jgi:putative flippase GtrA
VCMQMQHFGWNKESLWGLVVSLSIGAPTYLLDLGVIHFSLHTLQVSHSHAVAIGFVVAALFNYTMNRLFVYRNTSRSNVKAMVIYFAVAFMWLWFTVGATAFLADSLDGAFNFDDETILYIARTLVGVFVGVAGFVISSLYTFKIPTKRSVSE